MLSFKYIPDAIFIRVVLGTGRLTITRAMGKFFFWTRFAKLNLGNFQRKRKKKRISWGLEPVLIPLTGQFNYH